MIRFVSSLRQIRPYAPKTLVSNSKYVLGSGISDSLGSRRFQSEYVPYETNPRVSILTQIHDEPGKLHELLKYFWKYDIQLTHIESRPAPKGSDHFNIYIDFEGEIGDRGKTDKLMVELKRQSQNMLVLDEKKVPWFPRSYEDLDLIANRILDAGTDLEADHPGFHDEVYRKRRAELAQVAIDHRYGKQIPYVQYTQDEIKTWGTVLETLEPLLEKYACSTFHEIWPLLKKHCGYSKDNIPQAEDISKFLKQRTGFQIRPCAGLLSSRDFLNGLAFRTFFSTQYLRHSSVPLYTPEPDICHEFIGHVPMYAEPDFADLSQEIGLASLGASDEEIEKLARCYWYSVEFGLTREGNDIKAYGAGLLSSFGELEYACSPTRPAGGTEDTPEIKQWEPDVAAGLGFPITTYQPTYFVADGLVDAKQRMRRFCEELKKPFHARFNNLTGQVWVDRAVQPGELEPIAAPNQYVA
jgi:phenylalanine-4-hydroxylase